MSSFSSLALIRRDAYTLAGDDESPERVRGSRVTASLMPLLGITPQLGRAFTADEDADAAPPVVVLSDGLWRRRYGGDPAMLGRSVRINAVPHTVVGIMPRGASLPGPLAGDDVVWLPARMTPAERDGATSHNYTVVARLADGVSFERASAELAAFAARMAAEHPDSHRAIGARLVPVGEQTVRAIRPTLLVIGGGVALLLLVACANAATLLIARAASRRHEIRGPRRARRLPLATPVAGGRRVPGVLDARRRVRADYRTLGPARLAAAVRREPAAVAFRRHRRARRAVHRGGDARSRRRLRMRRRISAPALAGGRAEQLRANRRRRLGTLAHGPRGRAGDAGGRAAGGSGPDADEREEAVTREPGVQRGTRADVQARADRIELRVAPVARRVHGGPPAAPAGHGRRSQCRADLADPFRRHTRRERRRDRGPPARDRRAVDHHRPASRHARLLSDDGRAAAEAGAGSRRQTTAGPNR